MLPLHDRWILQRISSVVLVIGLTVTACGDDAPNAPPQKTTEEVAPPKLTVTEKWSVLVNPTRPRVGVVPLNAKAPMHNVEKLAFQGPQLGHPFCLGEFTEDGQFALVNGMLAVTAGKNALVSLGVADQFELEGIVDLEGFGGWLMLLGWNQGHGYSLSNVTLKDSGSPWFVCEYRAHAAIVPTNNEVKQLQWNGSKSFRLTMKNKELTVQIDQGFVVENYPLDNYSPGEILLGTYDTRYGPRPLKVQSLRIRSLDDPKNQEKAK